MIKYLAAASAALACQGLAAPAAAETSQTVTVTGETQEFSDDGGSLRTVQLEYKFENDDTTVVFTPAIGERRAAGAGETAVGGGIQFYHDWSDTVSTRTGAFVAENAPVFAQYDLAQDVTVEVAERTALTVGGRYARYFGGQDVTFLSAGVRQYFGFGSVAYRASWVNPEGRNGYLAHLVNVTVNDASGGGKTRLWLSAGEASLSSAQLPANFSGQDYAAALQRVQPISRELALVPLLGYSSYDRPGGRIDALNLGLGIALRID
jgi:YaiO family outer membrane protein